MARLTESVVEEATLTWLEALGWQVVHGPDIAPDMLTAERRDYGEVVLERRLRDALSRLNPELPAEALEDAFRKLTRPEGADLLQRNRFMHRLIIDGVNVEYRTREGDIRGAQAKVIDFEEPGNNDWLAVNQFTVVENKNNRRPDVVLFVNGLPLVVIELKNAADEDATIWTAFHQLQTYQAEIPSLFASNAVLVVSDGVEARVGALGAGREWFKHWRTVSGEEIENGGVPQLKVLLNGIFDKKRLLELVHDFVVFEDDGSGCLVKKIAGYHQFHAVRAAVAETLRAAKLARAGGVAEGGRYEAGRKPGGKPGDRRIGVVWHTQGFRKTAGGHGRQGDDRLHEPAHLRGTIQHHLCRGGWPPAPTPRLARRGRRPRRDQGGDDLLRLRSPRLAAAHPQQAAARGPRQTFPRLRRSAPNGAGARHVAYRVRCAQPTHHVYRQAHARPRADASHRPRQPRLSRQARRAGGGLPGPGP